MKLQEFTYTKRDGSVSERSVVVMQEPQHLVCGIDIAELTLEDTGGFLNDLRELRDRQALEMAVLLEKYDLKHRYRQFRPELMTNIKNEHI